MSVELSEIRAFNEQPGSHGILLGTWRRQLRVDLKSGQTESFVVNHLGDRLRELNGVIGQ